MNPDSLFQIANTTALIGWIVLLIGWFIPVPLLRRIGVIIPLLLSLGYLASMLTFWSQGEGGFDSLPAVMQLFTVPGLVLAGWIHYLAFDLLVGLWITLKARELGFQLWAILPCLVLTFMFGPVGFLLFCAIWFIFGRRRKSIPEHSANG